MDRAGFGVREVRIRGFRSARSVGFSPGPVCALVGGPSVGKSNVLAAVWMLLHRTRPTRRRRPPRRGRQAIRLSATLAGGDEIVLEASPPGPAARARPALPVVFLPASERSGRLVARAARGGVPGRRRRAVVGRPGRRAGRGGRGALRARRERPRAADRGAGAVPAAAVAALPPPPAAEFAEAGNQVLYSTHSAAFLDVGRLDELALVEWGPARARRSSTPSRCRPPRASARSASSTPSGASCSSPRAALLVEGRTEKMTLPFVFRALGHDADRLGDLDRRVRRQAEHPAVRPHLPRRARPVRRRPRPRRAVRQEADPRRARAQRADPGAGGPENVVLLIARLRGRRRPARAQPQAGARVGALLRRPDVGALRRIERGSSRVPRTNAVGSAPAATGQLVTCRARPVAPLRRRRSLQTHEAASRAHLAEPSRPQRASTPNAAVSATSHAAPRPSAPHGEAS